MTDRVALVTGAARGQGAAIVRRLRADGIKVAAADLVSEELSASVAGLADDGVLAVPLDVTSEQQWAAAVATVLDAFGSLSTLVNNAGILHRAALPEETAAGFERLWRVNTLGPFLGIQACLPALRQADGPSIVNTCSTGALRPFPNHAAYGSSKWGLRGLTQVAAAELAPSLGAMKAIPLAVAGAFHTQIMESARQRLTAALAEVPMKKPRIPVVSNVDAAPHDDPEEIRALLVQQLVSPVRWEDSVRYLLAQGCGQFYEVGPGRVLRGLLKRIDRKTPCEGVLE